MSAADRTITAQRLILHPIPLAVAHAILAGDLSAVRAGPGWPQEDTLDGLRGDVARGCRDGTGWFVCLRDGTVIGDCGWAGGPGPDGTAEIGYGVARPFRGHGYGTEAVAAFVGWALTQRGCTGLVARVLADNLASRRVLERLGFGLDRLEGGWLWYASGPSPDHDARAPSPLSPGPRRHNRRREGAGVGTAAGADTAAGRGLRRNSQLTTPT